MSRSLNQTLPGSAINHTNIQSGSIPSYAQTAKSNKSSLTSSSQPFVPSDNKNASKENKVNESKNSNVEVPRKEETHVDKNSSKVKIDSTKLVGDVKLPKPQFEIDFNRKIKFGNFGLDVSGFLPRTEDIQRKTCNKPTLFGDVPISFEIGEECKSDFVKIVAPYTQSPVTDKQASAPKPDKNFAHHNSSNSHMSSKPPSSSNSNVTGVSPGVNSNYNQNGPPQKSPGMNHSPNPHASPYQKQNFQPQGPQVFVPGNQFVYSPQQPGPQPWMQKGNFQPGNAPNQGPIPAFSPTHVRTGNKQGPPHPPQGGPIPNFPPGSSPGAPMGSAPGMIPPIYPGYGFYGSPNFDHNYGYPGYMPPPFNMHHGPGGMPTPNTNLTSAQLNTKAKVFVPSKSKAIAIVDPKTKQVVNANATTKDDKPATAVSSASPSSVQSASQSSATPQAAAPNVIRLSKPDTAKSVTEQEKTSEANLDVKDDSTANSKVIEPEAPKEKVVESKDSKSSAEIKPTELEKEPKIEDSKQVVSNEKVLETVKEIKFTKEDMPSMQNEKLEVKEESDKESDSEGSSSPGPTIVAAKTETILLAGNKSRRGARSERKILSPTNSDSEEEPKEEPKEDKPESSPSLKAAEPQKAHISGPPGLSPVAPGKLQLNRPTPLENVRPGIVRSSSNLTLSNTASSPISMNQYINNINYPSHISSPKLPDDKFVYDRSFLLQFKDACQSKPKDMKYSFGPGGDEGSRYDNDRRGGRRGHSFRDSKDDMGPKGKADDRFKLPLGNISRNTMHRSSSGTNLPGLAPNMSGDKGSRGRGGRSGGRGGKHNNNQQGAPTIPLDQVVPLEKTENRWVAKKNDDDREAVIARKVKSLLNKLTLEKFDSITAQIIEIGNESKDEDDGFTLQTVIKLIFEKATDEPNFSAMYAKLCVVMHNELDRDITDVNVKSKDGSLTAGGSLFRKYLLTRCQENYQKGWKTDVDISNPATADLMSDEYYIAAKKKRQGLGLLRFIGELFKLNMLTEKIMHSCIQDLVSKDPDDEEGESLAKLITTIGKQIDKPTNTEIMTRYFTAIKSWTQNKNLSQRIRFMLMDLIDLRKNKWAQKGASGPKTLQQIKEDADREMEEKARQEKLRRNNSSTGRPMPMHQNRSSYDQREPKEKQTDGWNKVSGTASLGRKQTGDISSFGNFTRSKTGSSSINLGPTSNVFTSLAGKGVGKDSKKPSVSRGSNMFDLLNQSGDSPKSSDGLTRPKLKLQPKSTSPTPDTEITDEPETVEEKLSAEALDRTIKNNLNEFLNIKDFKEAVQCINDLAPQNCNDRIVEKFINVAIDKKKEEISQVAELFVRLYEDNIISTEDFVAGAKKFAFELDELLLDVPSALESFALFLASYQLSLAQLVEIAEPLIELPSRLPLGPKFFIAYAVNRKQADKEEELVKELESGSVDLTLLYHPNNRTNEMLKKLVDNEKVQFLSATIQAAPWYQALQ